MKSYEIFIIEREESILNKKTDNIDNCLILLGDLDESMFSRGWESIKKGTHSLYDLIRGDKKTKESFEQYARILESPKTEEDRKAKEAYEKLKEEAEKARREKRKFKIGDILSDKQIELIRKHFKNFAWGTGVGFLLTIFPPAILIFAVLRIVYPMIILKASKDVDNYVKDELARREKEKKNWSDEQKKKGYYTSDSIQDIEFEVVESEELDESVSLVAASLVGIFSGVLVAKWLKLSLALRKERENLKKSIDPDGNREIFKNIENIRKHKKEIEREIERRSSNIDRSKLTDKQKEKAQDILNKLRSELEIQ